MPRDKRQKVSDADVLEMRRRYFVVGGYTQARLSREYGIAENTVARILAGTARQHVGMPKSAEVLEMELTLNRERFAALADAALAEQAAVAKRVMPVSDEVRERAAKFLHSEPDRAVVGDTEIVNALEEYKPPRVYTEDEIAANRIQADFIKQQECALKSGYPLREVKRLWDACADRRAIGRLINQLLNTSAEQKMQNEIDFLSKGDSL